MPCIVRGAGKEIVLLHGYLSQKESFYYQIEFLSAYYRVIAPDMPGFGASGPLVSAWSVGDYAEWFISFLRAQNATQVHILAHSFGARVAFKAISAHPEIAKSLIVTGGAGLVKPRSAEYLKKVRLYRRVKKIFPRFAQKHFGSEEYRRLPPVMRESYKKIVNEDLSACAAQIKCKTYLIYGREDTVTPAAEEGETFGRLIKNSRLELTEGGHFCFSQYPQEFNEKIFNFLREQ